jgi:hypothetical protein
MVLRVGMGYYCSQRNFAGSLSGNSEPWASSVRATRLYSSLFFAHALY